MDFLQEIGVIRQKNEIAPGVFDFTLAAPEIAARARPGQFVQVLCDGLTLRRPISIAGIDSARGRIRLVMETRGAGTAFLNALPEGGEMDLIGPLGHGFDLPGAETGILLVGGGIGTPPLLTVAAAHPGGSAAILGFRTARQVILQDDFAVRCAAVTVTTEDGSAGRRGFVTDAMGEMLEVHAPGLICACGPFPMLHAVAGAAKEAGIPCQVSLEERMACGVGACLVCACKVRGEHGPDYAQVCRHGPVFDADVIDWGE